MAVHGNALGAQDLLYSHGEERPGFDGRVVGDDHEQAAFHLADACDHSRRRRAAPFPVHIECCEKADLEEFSPRVDQLCDALARGETPFLVLLADVFRTASLDQHSLVAS